jgi:hypothetical protein
VRVDIQAVKAIIGDLVIQNAVLEAKVRELQELLNAETENHSVEESPSGLSATL